MSCPPRERGAAQPVAAAGARTAWRGVRPGRIVRIRTRYRGTASVSFLLGAPPVCPATPPRRAAPIEGAPSCCAAPVARAGPVAAGRTLCVLRDVARSALLASIAPSWARAPCWDRAPRLQGLDGALFAKSARTRRPDADDETRMPRITGALGLCTAAGAFAPAASQGPPGSKLGVGIRHQKGTHAMQAAPGMQGVDPMNGGGDLAQDKEKLYQLVAELSREETRETALLELSKKRETFPDLAPILWHSFGTTATLLQEIVCIYPLLSPPQLTAHASNRVCNALALLQCVASHQDTRQLFLKAHIPLFLYPFLNTISKTRPFEYLRLTSLGVIGALVKMDDSDVINFLLTTEIIPLCLRIMENGSDLSKTVATFIVQKILLDDTGLNYICATAERFFAVSNVLSNMVQGLTKEPSTRLLKHIIRCYLRLSENARARDALRHCLPEQLWDPAFTSCLREDASTKRWLNQLMFAVGVDPGAQGPPLQQHKPLAAPH